MGSAPPWFRFWGKDFDASTATWTVAEVGAYLRLLIAQWEAGKSGLPGDPERLQLACRCTAREWAEVWPALDAKFPVNGDGARRNARLEEVRKAHEENSLQAKKAAEERWRRHREENADASADALRTQSERICEIDASPSSVSSSDSDSSSTTPRGGSGGGSKRLTKKDPEIRWRVENVWAAHCEARRRFFTRRNGQPPPPPHFDEEDIGDHIRSALKKHDSELLGEEDRDRWRRESYARAAGIGLFLSKHHAGENDRGIDYLEPWRPWRRQRGKADPVATFADLYLAERSKR